MKNYILILIGGILIFIALINLKGLIIESLPEYTLAINILYLFLGLTIIIFSLFIDKIITKSSKEVK